MALRNLKAEIAKRGLTQTDIASNFGMSLDSLNARINERVDFSLSEMRKLRGRHFADCTFDYLFASDEDAEVSTEFILGRESKQG